MGYHGLNPRFTPATTSRHRQPRRFDELERHATYQLKPGCAIRLYLPNCSITWTEDWSATERHDDVRRQASGNESRQTSERRHTSHATRHTPDARRQTPHADAIEKTRKPVIGTRRALDEGKKPTPLGSKQKNVGSRKFTSGSLRVIHVPTHVQSTFPILYG